MKKILGITGIRSDYDLLSSLYRQLADTPGMDCRLLVGGAHLSRSYGHTVDMIIADNVPILARIESLIDGDTVSSRLKTASIFLQGAIDVVAAWAAVAANIAAPARRPRMALCMVMSFSSLDRS